MPKNCGNCQFFSVFFCSGACTNPDSKYVGELVGRNNRCQKWEEKKKETVQKCFK